VAFCGAYQQQDACFAQVCFGHSSDRKGHRRQLKVAHATTAVAIPLFGRLVDGGRDEGAQTGELLESLPGFSAGTWRIICSCALSYHAGTATGLPASTCASCNRSMNPAASSRVNLPAA